MSRFPVTYVTLLVATFVVNPTFAHTKTSILHLVPGWSWLVRAQRTRLTLWFSHVSLFLTLAHSLLDHVLLA